MDSDTGRAAANVIARIGGSGEQLDRLIMALVHTHARGKLHRQEIKEFEDVGVDILTVVAWRRTTTPEEISMLADNGSIFWYDVFGAFCIWSWEQGVFLQPK